MKNKTRRNFLKKSGLLTTGFFIVPRNVLGGNGFISPSDQLNIGAIGVGGKGQDIMGSWAKNERVIALCDVDPDNFVNGVTKSRKYYPKANFYEDFREMLDREKDLDAVTVSTPDHTHAIIASNAMKKGLHVYVQKPLTHNIQEARILTKLAKENKVVTQMGNQGGSCSGVSKIQEWIDKKLIGKVSKINVWTDRPVWPQGFQMKRSSQKKPNNLNWDLWLGPANYTDYTTELHPFNWRGWWDYGTGALGDMGCHLLDVPFKSLELGYPTGVECSVATVFEKAWNHNYVPEGCPSSSIVTLNFNETSKK
jgi:predicted dehydrogenase